MKVIKSTYLIFFIIIIMLSLPGCYYDKAELLYPGIPKCDTSNATYSGSVAPIMASNCNNCHSSASPSGGIITDNIASVKTNIIRIWGSVNHSGSFIPMPQNLPKLSSCNLTKIGAWKNAGMLNN